MSSPNKNERNNSPQMAMVIAHLEATKHKLTDDLIKMMWKEKNE